MNLLPQGFRFRSRRDPYRHQPCCQGRVLMRTLVLWLLTALAGAGVQAQQDTLLRFSPRNLGPAINGPGTDFNAWLTPDGQTLYFNAHRESCIGGLQPQLREGAASDFFASSRINGHWTPARNLGPPVNTPLHEKEFCLSADGQWLIFGRHPTSGRGRNDCDLWFSERAAGQWSQPENPGPPLNSSWCDSWPALSADGRTLYFISDRPGGVGGYDIWLSTRSDSGWTPPQNAGPTLNTRGHEYDVFLHPDGSTLYFTSNGHGGVGGYDILRSQRSEHGWLPPENPGPPLNTPYDEFDFFVNAAGTEGYINSNRLGGYGRQDLYVFTLPAEARPRPMTRVELDVAPCLQLPDPPTQIRWKLTEQPHTRQTPTPATRTYLTDQAGWVLYLPRATRWKAQGQLDSMTVDRLFETRGDSMRIAFCTTLQQDAQPQAPDTLRLDTVVYFDTGSADLRPATRTVLDALKHWLRHRKSQVCSIRLAGHTDARGTAADNEALSRRRIASVGQYLSASSWSDAELHTHAWGESRPAATNQTPEGQARNRRVEIRCLCRPKNGERIETP